MIIPVFYCDSTYGYFQWLNHTFTWYNGDLVGPGASYLTFAAPFERGVEYSLEMTAEGWFLTVMVEGSIVRTTNLRNFW